jgi:predicted GTPase
MFPYTKKHFIAVEETLVEAQKLKISFEELRDVGQIFPIAAQQLLGYQSLINQLVTTMKAIRELSEEEHKDYITISIHDNEEQN